MAIIFLAIFQNLVWDFNFLLVFVLVATLGFSGNFALILAFLAGLFLDLLGGAKLGFSSLGFLLPTFLLILYRQRFSFQNPLLILFLTLAYYALFSLITTRPFNSLEGAVLLALVMVFRFLVPSLFQGEPEKEPRLKL